MTVDSSVLWRSIRGRLKGNCRLDGVPSASEVESEGTRLLVASTDDLLGLGCDPRVREAAHHALRTFGLSRAEDTRVREEFEARVCTIFGAQAAVVISHEDSLLSLLPTWRMATEARGRRTISEAKQIATPEEAEGVLGAAGMLGLIVDAVHPLEGDLAPTPRFAEACQRRHASLLVIDDGLGVLGALGGGAIEHLSLQEQVALRVLPLGAAIPGSGAVVLGEPAVLDALRGALPPPPMASLAVAAKALEVAANESGRRTRVLDVAQKLLSEFRALGFDTGPCVTPWIPLWLGDEALCHEWLTALAQLGICCRGWLAGPRSRLLISAPATLTDAQVVHVLEVFERLSQKLQFPEATSRIPGIPVLARPGSYAMAVPAALHWTTVEPREPRPVDVELLPSTPPSSPEDLSLKDRVYDAVETMTWRATNIGSTQLRRSAEALRTLIDRRRR